MTTRVTPATAARLYLETSMYDAISVGNDKVATIITDLAIAAYAPAGNFPIRSAVLILWA